MTTTDCNYTGTRTGTDPSGQHTTATVIKATNGATTFTPTTGPSNIYLRAFDDAHNMSCAAAGACPTTIDPTP